MYTVEEKLLDNFSVSSLHLYNDGFLPDIFLLTQAPIFVWFGDTVIVYYHFPFNYVLHCLLFVMFGGSAW